MTEVSLFGSSVIRRRHVDTNLLFSFCKIDRKFPKLRDLGTVSKFLKYDSHVLLLAKFTECVFVKFEEIRTIHNRRSST